jgi:signal transduction histidine kinase/DNA-binding response OmpR family regulator/ligand-binding sensor domain-containing protein
MARFFRNIVFFLILFLTISYPLDSQSVDLRFDVLPVVTARCVFHDSFGFIWIGAFGGLLRYDGYNFKQYSNIPFDSTSLSNNWVMAINEDKNGNLWIGTFGGGLNYFNRRTEVFSHFNSRSIDNMSNMITKIIVNEDGSLWLGSLTHGITLFQNDQSGIFKVTNFPVTAILNEYNNGVLDIHEDKEGIIWIASTKEGLIKFNPQSEEMKKYKHDPNNTKSISFNTVSCITEDDSSNLWIGTGHPNIPPGYGSGLNMFNKKTREFKHFVHDKSAKNAICSNTISSLLVDKQGTLWIGSWDNFLNSVSIKDILLKNDPGFVHHTNLARDMIISLYEDRLENLWIGVFGMELYKIDRQRNLFTFYGRSDKYPDCLTHSAVSAICTGQSGKVLFGTRGLDIYNPEMNQYAHYSAVPEETYGLNDNDITGILEDSEGLFWIATRTNGINIFNPKSRLFKQIRHSRGDTTNLISNAIQCILKRPNGDIWIAAANGTIQLYEQSSGLFHNYRLGKGSKGDQSIYALCEDRNGVLWVGTMYSGMYRLTTRGNEVIDIKNYQHNPEEKTSLSNNGISDIIQPQVIDTNALWIATNIGLNRFDLRTKVFTHYFHGAGLASDPVLRILEDNLGNIWCATINGLSVYEMRSGKIKSYGKGDGMPFTDFSNLGQNAAKSHDGRLFFGGLSGALSFNPNQFTDNPNIPPIVLTDFKVFHESVNLDTAIQFKKTIFLSHNQNEFSFDFTALNFTNPEKNQYAYKMDGFLDDWINIGNERSVSFTNLDPGEYTFWVKGSNNHGIWNEKGISVKVIIHPPWWRTNFAYTFYIIFITFAIWLFWRFQINRLKMKQQFQMEHLQAEKLKEVDHLKSQFFANISHEFRTPLTLILGPVRQMFAGNFKGNFKEQYKSIIRNAERLLNLINQLLDLSKLESGKLKLQAQATEIIKLTNGLVQAFESLAGRKEISLKFISELKSQECFVDVDKFEKVINNLLSNALKFTQEGGVVKIRIEHPPVSPLGKGGLRGVQISISNTGPGIPADQIEKIFNRFYQANNLYKKELAPLDKINSRVQITDNYSYPTGEQGTGIGLALTKELVELHHGEIKVESEPDNKTTFTIVLPLGKEHLKEDEIIEPTPQISPLTKGGLRGVSTTAKEDQPISQKTSPTCPPTGVVSSHQFPMILIVEDNADLRNYIRSNIDDSYQILEAENGIAGWEQATKEIPDLIISDVMMPEMDGFELCSKLKTDQRTSHIPVILLTARAAKEDKIEGLETGADDFIPKPFDTEELQIRIKNLINQRKKLREQFRKESNLVFDQITHTSADEKFITRIMDIISKHISNSNFNLDSLSNEAGMSQMHLHRKIKGLFGQSPAEFVKTIRLKQGAEMLKSKTGNISEIAYKVGFDNPAYFSTCFRQQFGINPSEFIKNLH